MEPLLVVFQWDIPTSFSHPEIKRKCSIQEQPLPEIWREDKKTVMTDGHNIDI
jgi:hypothetical protein